MYILLDKSEFLQEKNDQIITTYIHLKKEMMKKNLIPVTTITTVATIRLNCWQKIKQHAKKQDHKLKTVFAVLSSVL